MSKIVHHTCVTKTFNDGENSERKKGRKRAIDFSIDGDYIKIMNGHIIASWQSNDVSRRVIYRYICRYDRR